MYAFYFDRSCPLSYNKFSCLFFFFPLYKNTKLISINFRYLYFFLNGKTTHYLQFSGVTCFSVSNISNAGNDKYLHIPMYILCCIILNANCVCVTAKCEFGNGKKEHIFMSFTEKLNITQKVLPKLSKIYPRGNLPTLCYVLLYTNIYRVYKSQNMRL
jgi:hypothetical protein